MSFWKYEYCETKGNERQYDDIDFLNMKGVEARYVKIDSDKGNPYIEALPKPRTKEELNVACRRGLLYDHEEELKKGTLDKVLSVLKLRDVRYPLPFNYELEDEIYSALVLSYRRREMFMDAAGDIEVPYEARNKTEHSSGRLVGSDASATNAGLTMIGYSGCGKSSALEMVFNNYPQYIVHKGPGMTTFPQIVYLVVQCPPHSNFRGLYKNIGIAIDRALGNILPVYEKELDAGERGNLSIYNNKVRECIEKFAIGIIIFDEIQHLEFNTAMENSFESILVLSNQTKVAFGVVGTEDAYEKIFTGNIRQARRLGTEIHADRYCKNKELFTYLAKQIFSYQWFNELVEPNGMLIDVLYDHTKGIIDQLVGLYIFMNIDYIRAGRKPQVNEKYVHTVMERHYPGMMELLQEIDKPEAEQERVKLVKNAKDELEWVISEEKAKAAEAAVMSVNANPDSTYIPNLKQFVISRITDLDPSYNASTIEKAVNQVLNTKAGKERLTNEKEILQMTYKRLKTMSATDKRKQAGSSKKISPEQMIDFLNAGNEEGE